jgi:uncharacterized cupin superfamily protein
MHPVLISNPTKMALPDVGPVAVPVGQPVAQLKCSEAVSLPDQQVEAGVWECTPGVWSRQVKQAELCHFIAGHCFFTPEGGQPIEIRAGDAVLFPAQLPRRLGCEGNRAQNIRHVPILNAASHAELDG